ncbi:hypothetical protein Q0F98_21465 [Paenibacillus amylolyticus]|nr:hypothetical protein Q0F98_21465 [Paenibacillus amylolyticus]
MPAILLDAGASVTPDMKESVKRIGKDFEFVREKFNKDKVDGVSDALIKLYRLFDVEPVANRIMHDGTAPIQVKATTWPKQHQELWEYLIPAQGHAQTVQGEVIRITGRVSHEVLDNGGGNWDAEYRKMLDALIRYLGTGAPLAPHFSKRQQTWPAGFIMDTILMRLPDYPSWQYYGCLPILSQSL